ncbi:MAG: threonine--tRNA ligase [Candidatus Omnitrophica bacterium]|nr:threonine--tRNA ligase [Candidatus Omnitrophota bacterium]
MQTQNLEALHHLRHSAAHIMAQAVLKLFPETKITIGPAIKEGFYYDLDRDTAFTEEDLTRIEEEMARIVKEGQEFRQEAISKADAEALFQKLAQPYKIEMLRDLKDGEITIVTNGPFTDLCEGGHIQNSRELKAFKLLTIAGAYWRGDEKNKMLQRIYGTAFFTQDELKAHLTRLEEAKKRDHRKLGKQLDLFSFHDESPAMVFFHAKGFFLFNTLIDYLRQKLRVRDYQEVQAPTVLTDDLWKKSGHYDNFRENMYFTKQENREYAVKPMNCPGHALIFQTHQHSYRDLPLRIAEFGKVHRYERSGVTHGLMRVRAFTQDDAHHFCTEDQLQCEIEDLIDFTHEVYQTFGFTDYQVAVSTRPPLSMGSPEVWNKATEALKQALTAKGIAFEIHEGEGAFYGPKIEFVIFDSLGREWQCGTIQVDFSMPERFGLEYVAADGSRKRPVMVHRAIYGSIERFLGILIEHYAGAFPVWLSPVQVKILTLAESHADHARALASRLRNAGIRVEEDYRPEKIGYKVREAETSKIPYALVLGDKEIESGQLAVRARGRRDLGLMTEGAFIERITGEIRQYQ